MAVKLLIYKTSGGGVSCKLNFNNEKSSVTYHHGKGKLFRWNRGKDREEYPLIVSYSYLDDFLSINNIDYKTVEIDKNSIDEFYGYSLWNKELFFANLTQRNIDKWWNYDASNLYRYSVNKGRHSNMWGLNLICFSNKLVECGLGNIYIDEDITKEEVKKITKGHESSHIFEEMWHALNAQKLSGDEINFLAEEVKKYEDKIQEIIDKYSDEILISINGMEDGTYGLDLGFLNIYTENPQYNERKGLLKNIKRDSASWMNICMPYEPQSLTIKKKEFQKVKEIVARESGEELYCQTILD